MKWSARTNEIVSLAHFLRMVLIRLALDLAVEKEAEKGERNETVR